MEDCLSNEIIEALSERRFQGSGYFEVLKHLEDCEVCSAKIKTLSQEAILQRLTEDESFPSNNQKKDQPNNKLLEDGSSSQRLFKKLFKSKFLIFYVCSLLHLGLQTT